MFWRGMYYDNWGKMPPFFWWILTPLVLWDVIWKGIALWKSAGHRQKGWFVTLLIVNSLGILPIIYLAFFQKKRR